MAQIPNAVNITIINSSQLCRQYRDETWENTGLYITEVRS